jgi:shikimate kinase
VNLVIVGPCGVGKSTVAMSIARRANLSYLDFDALGLVDMQTRKFQFSPFSVSKLNFRQCLPPLISSVTSAGFVLDIGGETVFRKNVDNHERLDQVLWLKETYTSFVIVLTASRNVLLNRFISAKNRSASEFDRIWDDWVNIAEPYWQKCGNIFVDTSFLAVDEIIVQIEAILNRR